MAEFKVLITTSGLGTRLGNITKYTNKSLVRVGDKPAISHIIDCYHKETEFIVTLGHYGSHVKQYLKLAHPDHNFKFVEIDNYIGEESSLLYSMSLCEQHLQCPFIFHACDTILPKNYINSIKFNSNWCVGGFSNNNQAYRTINCINDKIISINERGEYNFDYVYVGVSGIFDFKNFWRICNSILRTTKTSDLSDCHVIRKMKNFYVVKIDEWYDIGNVDALKLTREKHPASVHVLDKEEENIFIFDEFVIKFFYNKKICHDRIIRSKTLQGLVPNLLEYSENFYKYAYVKADLLSDVIDTNKFKKLLNWSVQNLWNPKIDEQFKSNAVSFYKEKSILRIKKFLEKYNIPDKNDNINGIDIPPIKDLIDRIDFDSIIGSYPTGFHGDFILDNILIDADRFVLIDWRQDFNGNVDAGDMRYDLAKLNHNLTLNHEILIKKQFYIEYEDKIRCDVLVKNSLLECQEILKKFCDDNKISYTSIKILTSLIWLNMSPLHEHPLDMFLYYFGKYNLFLNLERLE